MEDGGPPGVLAAFCTDLELAALTGGVGTWVIDDWIGVAGDVTTTAFGCFGVLGIVGLLSGLRSPKTACVLPCIATVDFEMRLLVWSSTVSI